MPRRKSPLNKKLTPKADNERSKKKGDNIVGTRGGKIMVMDSVEKFTREFLKNGGNVTKAALAVGNFSSLNSANTSGQRWLAKSKQRGLIRNALEEKGYGYGKLIDVALEKMEKSKKPDWWDRIMKMADYDDFTSSGKVGGTNVSVNIPCFAAHRKLSEEYIDDTNEVIEGETLKDENKS